MGDKRRNRIFAEFIGPAFVHHRTVAEVAGGKGELSFLLQSEQAKIATLIDPHERSPARYVALDTVYIYS